MVGDSDDLNLQIRRALGRLYRRVRAEQVDGAITESQGTTLNAIARRGALTLRELADQDGVTPPTMNLTVNALEALGLVARAAHPDDGRKVLVSLTPAGTSAVADLRRRRHDWLEGRLQALSPDDLAVLDRATRLMIEMAES